MKKNDLFVEKAWNEFKGDNIEDSVWLTVRHILRFAFVSGMYAVVVGMPRRKRDEETFRLAVAEEMRRYLEDSLHNLKNGVQK